MIPFYWDEALAELSRRDAVMRRFVKQYRGICLRRRSQPFATLARSIVGQQISVKAADTVWARFEVLVGRVVPENILVVPREKLAACGLSRRKVEYLFDLADRFEGGLVHIRHWPHMDDEAVIQDLVQVRGIGRWTAEMFLIFGLLRPNVFPLDDIGLQRAIALHYFDGQMPDRQNLQELGSRWAPWRTVATWHLWRSLDSVLVEY